MGKEKDTKAEQSATPNLDQIKKNLYQIIDLAIKAKENGELKGAALQIPKLAGNMITANWRNGEDLKQVIQMNTTFQRIVTPTRQAAMNQKKMVDFNMTAEMFGAPGITRIETTVMGDKVERVVKEVGVQPDQQAHMKASGQGHDANPLIHKLAGLNDDQLIDQFGSLSGLKDLFNS